MGKPCRIARAVGTHIFQLPQSLCPSELIFGWAEVRTLVIFGNKFIKQGRKRIPNSESNWKYRNIKYGFFKKKNFKEEYLKIQQQTNRVFTIHNWDPITQAMESISAVLGSGFCISKNQHETKMLLSALIVVFL